MAGGRRDETGVGEFGRWLAGVGAAVGAAAVAGALLAACAPPAGGPVGPPGAVYVVDPGAGGIVRADPQTGQAIGRPMPGGRAPWQAVAGPRDGLLVLSAPVGVQELTQVIRAGPGWAARPVPVAPGMRGAVLGGDGDRYAALAYRPASADAGGPTGCRLALLDLDVGAVVRTHDVCGPGEAVRDVALAATASGPVAYLSLWRGAAAGAGEAGGWRPDGRGRVVALAAETGRVLAVHAPAGVPDRLLLGPAPGGGGRRVYYLETALPPPDGLEAWRLVGLDAATLTRERNFALPDPPHSPVLAPDGARLYALAADAGGGRGADRG